MVQRNCAGGVVFHGNSIFLLKNDKSEWVLPKGVIRDGLSASDVALGRVFIETGVSARITAPCGETMYEFNSLTRSKFVRNHVQWFLMEAETSANRINFQQGFLDGGWFEAARALELITHAQDKALIENAIALRGDVK